jgi:hypothetical protein
MQRGKPSVQHYEGTAQEMLKTLESDGTKVISLRGVGQSRNGGEDPAGGEPAGHIVQQLRLAYDELLCEPIPDHLRKLLATLSELEDK